MATVARLPEVTWTLAGGAQDEADRQHAAQLAQEIASHQLEERVHMTGYLAHGDLETLTAGATLAVFPFDHVTGSGSIALAIALGMPIIASDLPALRELVEAGAGLRLLPHAETESWTDPIERLLASPDELEALAAANREFAQSHSFARAGERLGNLYDDVLTR
jgi:glycosyltransferase involved in cell wall biosynthesis